MDTSGLLAVPLIAWLSCGLAAVSLTPRNRSAQALCASGVLWVASWRLEVADGPRFWIDLTFLGGLVGVVTLLLTFPGGVFAASWHRYVVAALGVLAVAGPVLCLADPVSEVGDVVVASEPLWILVGVALLLQRYRAADPGGRRELWPLLTGIGLLAAMLVIVVITAALGSPAPDEVGEPAFLFALAVLPVVLLWGISTRTRALDRRLAASRARLIEAEDKVRRTIERDLHDGVQQQLVAILSLTELATRQVERDPPLATEALHDVREQVTTAITDLRELVYGIRPPVLEDAGVSAALASRLQKLGPDVRLTGSGASVRWPPEAEAAAYFVACEAVTNALKHAPGSAVVVRVIEDPDVLQVEVGDDGPGIDGLVPGRGLSGLRDRVESIGGISTWAVASTVEQSSSPGSNGRCHDRAAGSRGRRQLSRPGRRLPTAGGRRRHRCMRRRRVGSRAAGRGARARP